MSASWDVPRAPAATRILVATGADHGLSVTRCLRGTGLTEEQLADDSATVEAGQELQVVRNLVEALGDPPGLGVDAGRRTSLGTLGIWSFAVLSSPTWGEALALGVRFAGLSSTFFDIEIEASPTELRLVLHDDAIPGDVREFITERDLAAVAVIVPSIVGTAPSARIETRLTGERAAALAALVPASLHLRTGRPVTVLATDPAVLGTPLPQADPATRRALERECARVLDARRTRTGTAARVRALLLQAPSRMPSMEAVAAAMHLDVRTLRRHLDRENTSYRALREEVGEALAIELLQTVGLSVGEVAARLGFADPTAFTHAFTRWTGRPPSHFRPPRTTNG